MNAFPGADRLRPGVSGVTAVGDTLVLAHPPGLDDTDLAEFVELQKTQADTEKSWSVDAATIDTATYDLSVKNPNGGEEVIHRSPQTIMDEIAALDAESAEVLANIRALL
jgi:type I restriction enzyme M protein